MRSSQPHMLVYENIRSISKDTGERLDVWNMAYRIKENMMFRLKDQLFALSGNDTGSGGKPSTDSGFYSGLDKGPSKPVQPPKDKYSETMGDGSVGKTINADPDGSFC